MASLLCETVTGDTMAELLAARDAAAAADMVELRLDGVRDLDVARALHGRRGPVIVTCRPTWEGGRFDGSEDSARAGARAGARGRAPITWTSNGRPRVRRPRSGEPLEDRRSRRTISPVSRPTCARARGAMRAHGCGGDQGGRDRGATCRTRCRCCELAKARRCRRHRHGRRRRAEPAAGDTIRIPMDVRRQRRRARSDSCGAHG